MAETVLYLLNSTDDSTRIAIQPRTYDGVGGVQRNTDLTLYGNGAPNWGERFDENFYHLMENFAVQQEATLPITPKNENDLVTVGLGINNPIEGQIWYNKTTGGLFAFTRDPAVDGTAPLPTGPLSWRPIGTVGIVGTTAQINGNLIAGTPRDGEFAYDTTTAELKIRISGVWVAAANYAPATRAVNTTGSLVGGGNLTVDRTLSLRGDINTPDPITPSQYYGSNAFGIRGFYNFPSGGSVTSINATGSTGISVSGGPITTSGVLAFTLTGDLPTLSGIGVNGIVKRTGAVGSGVYTAAGIGDIASALGFTPANSAITITGSGSVTGGGNLTASRVLSLINDNASPGPNQYYGTDAGGIKGFFTQQQIGIGQTWTSPGKNKGIVYVNATGRPIQVMVTMNITLGGGSVGIVVNGLTMASAPNISSGDNQIAFSFIVPPGQSYSAFGIGSRSNVLNWVELV